MVDESELNGMFLVEGSDDIFVVVGCKSGCEKLNTKVGSLISKVTHITHAYKLPLF